ncbi:hypothetical protein ACQPYH_21985 [Kribbella sp. CA-245084]|uniref:hypothetical protein n=1 Tax=Kribbella sp. CA-245084 TaxID=3239940 RepID=UPI003D8FABA8
MRVVRSIVGVLLALIGLIVSVVGGLAAFWLVGPDDTVHSGEQALSSKGLAIASTPDLLNRHGPVLHVDVRSAKGAPVFVGVARDFDVSSYLKGFQHTKLVQVQFPISLSTQDEKGTAGPLAAPSTLDWWVTKSNGAGTQSIAWPIEDGPYDVVIMNADGTTPPDVQANLGIEIPHSFVTALAIFAAGLILLALGILLTLFRRRPAKPTPPPAGPQYAGPQFVPTAPAQQPSSQPGGGTVRRIVAFGLVLSLATGCSAIPERDTVDTLTRPAIATTAAAAVIKHYNEVTNKANSTRDDKLIATVAGGSVLRRSQAGYLVGRTFDKAGKDPIKPFSYTKPVLGAPVYGGYPMHFAASSGISTEKNYRHLGVWERQTAGSAWLQTFSVNPKTTTKVPDITGLRQLTAADTAKLTAAPQAAATALAQYLTVGAKSPRAGAFAPSTEVTAVLAEMATEQKNLLTTEKFLRAVSDTFTVTGTPVAFMTKSGEALVFVSLTDEYVGLAASNYQVFWESGASSAFSPKTSVYQSALTSTVLYDCAFVVPRKAGKIRVLGMDRQTVAAGGY